MLPDPAATTPACAAPAGPARLFVALWPPRGMAAALARRHAAPLAAAPPGWPLLRWPVRQFVLAGSPRGKPGRYGILHRCNAR